LFQNLSINNEKIENYELSFKFFVSKKKKKEKEKARKKIRKISKTKQNNPFLSQISNKKLNRFIQR